MAIQGTLRWRRFAMLDQDPLGRWATPTCPVPDGGRSSAPRSAESKRQAAFREGFRHRAEAPSCSLGPQCVQPQHPTCPRRYRRFAEVDQHSGRRPEVGRHMVCLSEPLAAVGSISRRQSSAAPGCLQHNCRAVSCWATAATRAATVLAISSHMAHANGQDRHQQRDDAHQLRVGEADCAKYSTWVKARKPTSLQSRKWGNAQRWWG